jgi:hypothetical protein
MCAPSGSASVIGPDNRLICDGTYAYAYDAEGNCTARFVGVNDDRIDSFEIVHWTLP